MALRRSNGSEVRTSTVWYATNALCYSPGQALGPQGSTKLRLPEFLDNRQLKVTSLSDVCSGRFYLPAKIYGAHFC